MLGTACLSGCLASAVPHAVVQNGRSQHGDRKCHLAVTCGLRSWEANAAGLMNGGQAMRVLVTEDDEILATAVAAGLRREGMAVDVALDGDAALERLAVNRYDVVVLDRDLPGVHGDDVCRALAADRSETRVLMLTAARSVQERIEGLDLGADDYLPKPFDFAELIARIRALGRRAATPVPATLQYGDLTLD